MKPVASSSSPPVYAFPIAQALKKLAFRLSRPGLAHLVIGLEDIEEARQQPLPDHVRFSSKQRVGERVVRRHRHRHDQAQLIRALWPEDYMVESSQFSLACVMAGSADFQIGSYTAHCQTGDMMLFLPNIPRQDGQKVHFDGEPSNRICEILWLSPLLRQDYGLRGWICRCEGDVHFRSMEMGNCSVQNKLLADLFTGICEQVSIPGRRELAHQLLSCMVSLFHDEIELGNVMQSWGRPRPEENTAKKDPISEAMVYMQEHIDTHLTIDIVAAHCLVSPSTLTRHLKKRTNKTFLQYLTEIRLKRADELLRNTNYTVKSIADHVGLKQGQFWVLFKTHYGCSPSDFRNANKN